MGQDDETIYRFHHDREDTLVIARKDQPVAAAKKADTRHKLYEKLSPLKRLIRMRNLARTILDLQTEYADDSIAEGEDPPWAEAQRDLADQYDVFVSSHGPIQKVDIRETGRIGANGESGSTKTEPNLRLFRADPDASFVRSLEEYDEITGHAKKGAIFSERIVAAKGESRDVNTPEEALGLCLSDYGTVDLAYITSLLDNYDDEAEIEEILSGEGLIFHNPDNDKWECAENYLSGNVREKLERAQDALAKDDKYRLNIQALEEVMPADLGPDEIDVSIGAPWMPKEIIEQFAREELHIEKAQVFYFGKNHIWYVKGHCSGMERQDHEYATTHIDPEKMLCAALNDKRPPLRKRKDEYKQDIDRVAELTRAEERIANMKERFREWLWENDERKEQICAYYNRRFNAIVPPKYDGNYLRLPGAAVNIDLRKHQRDFVARALHANTNTMAAHSTGAGKTWASSTACMEMKRLGQIEKPMFVLPPTMRAQFSRDFMKIYPNADTLVIDDDRLRDEDSDLTPEQKTEKIIDMIRNFKGDAVFISQPLFDRIGTSPQTKLQMALDELRELRAEYNGHYGREDAPHKMLKDIEKSLTAQKKKIIRLLELKEPESAGEDVETDDEPEEWDEFEMLLEEENTQRASGNDWEMKHWNSLELEELVDENADSDGWRAHLEKLESFGKKHFEDMDVDHLLVDEFHAYKNLEINSRHMSLARQGSARAQNMEAVLHYMNRKKPGKNITPLTATPVSNSMSEIYTMQRYLQPELLKAYGIECFDAWAAMFGEMVESVEMAPSGDEFRLVNRLGRYKNLPELLRMFHSFADVVPEEDLDQKKPELQNDEPEKVFTEMNGQIKEFYAELAKRYDAVCSGSVPLTEDNVLSIYTDSRLVTVHPSLVGLEPEPGQQTKLDALVETVARVYHENKDNEYTDTFGQPDPVKGGMQQIFSDLGIPDGLAKESVYHLMKEKLVSAGVPEGKIRFVHEFDTDRKQVELSQLADRGDIAVLIGTTEKLGTGKNLQKRTVALHHFDVPFLPLKVIQRNGRILRPGNQNDVVRIFYHVLEKSADVILWGLQKYKSAFIHPIMNPDYSIRTYKETDDFTTMCGQIMALAANNPLIFEKREAEQEVERLLNLKTAHEQDRQRARLGLRQLRQKIGETEREIRRKNKMLETMTLETGDSYPLALNDKNFPDAQTTGAALKETLRDMRSQLRDAAEGADDTKEMSLKQDIGALYGLNVRLKAKVKVTEKKAPGKQGKQAKNTKPVRTYKYCFSLQIGDTPKTEIIVPEEKIREKRTCAAEDFDAATKNAELAEMIVGPFREMEETLIRDQEALEEMSGERERLTGLIAIPFERQDELNKARRELRKIDRQLMKLEGHANDNADPEEGLCEKMKPEVA